MTSSGERLQSWVMLQRLLENYAPSVLLTAAVAATGTFFGGLKFAVAFLFAIAVSAIGEFLDNY